MLKLDKNAYLQIDLIFAITIFFGIFVSFFFMYSDYKSQLNTDLELNNLASISRDLCYLLVSTPGLPNSWEQNVPQIQVIGLKNLNSSDLNSSKVAEFVKDENYEMILDTINSSVFIYSKIIGLSTGTQYAEMGIESQISTLFYDYNCYANYQGEQVKIFLEVWK